MTGAVRVTAVLADGSSRMVESVKALRITAALETPAVSLWAVFAGRGFAGQEEIWRRVRVHAGETLLFEGAPDIKRDTISAKGAVTELEARSDAAALLDNQARPGQMTNPTAETVFKQTIAPYGFRLLMPEQEVALPFYTVYAGTSEWAAFAGFARRVYRVTPYVNGRMVVIRRPGFNGEPLRISNTGEGVPFSALMREQKPYNMLSAVILRGEDGAYASVMNNPAAISRGITRRRFVTPPNEFVNDMRFDADRRLRKSTFDAEAITAELPGIHTPELGADASVEDISLRAMGLLVAKREIILDERGVFTRLTLQNALYYD